MNKRRIGKRKNKITRHERETQQKDRRFIFAQYYARNKHVTPRQFHQCLWNAQSRVIARKNRPLWCKPVFHGWAVLPLKVFFGGQPWSAKAQPLY